MKSIAAALLLALAGAAQADVTFNDTTLTFATRDAGRQILQTRDPYVQGLSPFDRQSRLKTSKEVSEKEFLDFSSRNAIDWPDRDKARVQAALEALQPKLAALSLPFPKTVSLVYTTGAEEGDAAYTRGTAIFLPPSMLRGSAASIQDLIAHELFHVLSRANPALRDRTYAAIGFVPCEEVPLPADLQARKISNPDAPLNDHCIRLQVDGKPAWAVPLLLSSSPTFDLAKGDSFFDYLQFKWLIIDRADNGKVTVPLVEGKPRLLEMRQVSNFYEQVGRNTGYTIHEEEILADNFQMIVQEKTARNPEILARIKAALPEPATRPAPSTAPRP